MSLIEQNCSPIEF